MHAEPIDGYDARMFQIARDFCFCNEAAAADRIVGGIGLNFLERHLTMQLAIFREEDLAEAALGVELDRLESSGGVRQGGSVLWRWRVSRGVDKRPGSFGPVKVRGGTGTLSCRRKAELGVSEIMFQRLDFFSRQLSSSSQDLAE
jgi:hypothetical protein